VPSTESAFRQDPHLLATIFTPGRLIESLPPPGSWRPVPPVTDRVFWDAIDRTGLVERAARFVGNDWPNLTASLWRDYRRTGNRVHYQDPYFARRDRLAAAVLAACLTDEQPWHDEATDGIWQLLEETSWCIPPHEKYAGGAALPDPANPTLDLFAAETGGLLAWTHSVLGDRLEATVARRLVDQVIARVLVPQRTLDDGIWLGRKQGHVNNWNPWINANVLTCSFLLDRSAPDIRLTVQRVVEGLDVFLRDYPDDGGCDEGASYWWRAGASLAECLEMLRLTTGLDAFGLPVIAEMARYLHRVHIAGDWYVNVGDGTARLDRTNAEPHLAWWFGRRVGDPVVSAHGRAIRGSGAAIATEARLGRGMGRALLALTDREWQDAPDQPAPHVLQSYLPDTELLIARSVAGRTDGLLLSMKGGNNAASHNHNDVGSVLVALDGHPVLVDAGVAEYTAQHFNAHRYEIWTMRSEFHNVPSVDGYEQAPGAAYAAAEVHGELSADRARMSLDLAGAYPAAAGIRSWRRAAELDRGAERITLTDSWELDHDPKGVALHLLSSAEPISHEGGLTIPTPGRSLVLSADPNLDITIEPIELADRRLSWVWGESLWRITLQARPTRTGSWTIAMTAGP